MELGLEVRKYGELGLEVTKYGTRIKSMETWN